MSVDLLTSNIIMARPSQASRTDTNYDFIVYKTQEMDKSPFSDQSRTKPNLSSRGERQNRYNLDVESVLAFGGMRRKSRTTKKQIKHSEHSSKSIEVPRSPSVSSGSSKSYSCDESTLTSDSEDQSDWAAFRAKYEAKHEPHDEMNTCGGRYGPGRGSVEYRHRHDCDGSCRGICFGK